MARYQYYNVSRDGEGKVIGGATISVYKAGGLVAANVYVASSGGSAVNSVTSDSTNGMFIFYVDTGDYASTQQFKTVQSKTGYSDAEIDNIRIYPEAIFDDDDFTLQDNADTTKKLQFQLSGLTTSTTRTLTVPDTSDTITLNAAVQVLSSKTFSDVIVASGGIKLDGSNALKIKIIDIGDWDMDATSELTINHGLTRSDIRSVSGVIRNDVDNTTYPIHGGFDTDLSLRITSISSTQVIISRETSGFFDSASFNSTSYNRGWITIMYTV